MITKYEPNKVTATLKVVVTGEFYGDEVTEETLRYCIEQDLEDAGFDVDVSLLKEQEPKKPIASEDPNSFRRYNCPKCGRWFEFYKPAYCDKCGQAVKWE
jgi:hypothetical protein